MPLPRRFAALLLVCAAPAAWALQCPEMPKQASRDTEVEVRVGVRLLGDAKGTELETRTRQLTTDLLGKVPRADRVYLEQMLFAAYCSSVRDNAALTEGEREARVLAYRREMQKALAGGNAPARADPRDQARAELARLPVPYTADALHAAIREGNLRVVRLFIAAGMDLAVPGREGWPPLMSAHMHDQPAVVDALIDAGAPATGGALASIAVQGDLPRLRRLLARQPAQEVVDDAFVAAASLARLDALDLLRPRAGELRRLGPLAVQRIGQRNGDDPRSVRALEWLHAQGVPIDTPDEHGWTPAMNALSNGALESVRAFVRLGVNLRHRCACSGYLDGGMTPLLVAAARNDEAALRVLLDAGADPTDRTARGRNALHLLLDSHSGGPAAQLLLERGTPHDAVAPDGTTPLMLAALNGPAAMVTSLLARGARVDAVDREGRTPLGFAAVRDRDDVAAVLVDAGAPLEARTVNGRTPLVIAVRNHATDTVRLLLQRGARADAADRDGLKPIDHARALSDNDAKRAIVRLLENAAR